MGIILGFALFVGVFVGVLISIALDEFSASSWIANPIKRPSRRAEMLFYAGQYWRDLGQAEKARDCYEACVELGIRDLNVTRMAKVMLARESPQAGQEKQALRISPKFDPPILHLGQVLSILT